MNRERRQVEYSDEYSGSESDESASAWVRYFIAIEGAWIGEEA